MLSKKFQKKHIQFYVLEKELERFKSRNLKPKWLKPPELEIVFNSFTFYLSFPPLLFPWSAFFCFNFPIQIRFTVTTNEVRWVDCFYRSKNKRVERKFSSRSSTSCIEESFYNQVYRLQQREPELDCEISSSFELPRWEVSFFAGKGVHRDVRKCLIKLESSNSSSKYLVSSFDSRSLSRIVYLPWKFSKNFHWFLLTLNREAVAFIPR